METRDQIQQQLDLYLQKYPIEKSGLEPFIDFLKNNEAEQLYSRKNFNGHITASAFIVNQQNDKLLLLKHKALKRWLQPGGHVDLTDESLLSAARREAEEETGIGNEDLAEVNIEVFDFDSHIIPANDRKQEPQHYHHDIRYLFRCNSDVVTIAEEESTDFKWVPLEALTGDSIFARVVDKIKAFG